MNQTHKNVRLTKVMETCDATTLKGKKVRDIGIHVYNVRETIFSNQTGIFPKRSQRGYKCIMVMVKIDSNAILVKPMKSRKDEEMIRAYDALLARLRQAGSTSEVVIWLIWGIQAVFSTYFFVFSYFSVERIVFYFGLST